MLTIAHTPAIAFVITRLNARDTVRGQGGYDGLHHTCRHFDIQWDSGIFSRLRHPFTVPHPWGIGEKHTIFDKTLDKLGYNILSRLLNE